MSGIPITIKNAGKAISNSCQWMFFKLAAISTPTIINAGDVTVEGITVNKGLNTSEIINRNPTNIEVNPVRPPMAMPADDSTDVPNGAVPKIAPSTIANESDKNAFPILGILPYLSTIPACCVIPIRVPAVSKKVTSKKVITTINN